MRKAGRVQLLIVKKNLQNANSRSGAVERLCRLSARLTPERVNDMARRAFMPEAQDTLNQWRAAVGLPAQADDDIWSFLSERPSS